MPNSSMNHATGDTTEFTEWNAAQPVLQGHDGSIWKCFGDYRDRLLLEFEKRIYNNLKQDYDESIVDLADFIESDFRSTGFTRQKIANVIIAEFNTWLETVGVPDYTKNDVFTRGNSFTYNYLLWQSI